MMVANDVSIDVRVRKMAASVAKHHNVSVLGLATNGKRSTFELDGFQVILLPVVSQKPLRLRIRKALGRRVMKLPMGTSIRRLLKSKAAKAPVVIDKDHKTGPASKKSWREVLPETLKYEQVFGSELQRINPDLVHAQDIHLLSVAAKHVEYRIQQGSTCGLIYDAHEYIRGLGSIDPQRRDAYADLESEFIVRADSVITVSDSIAKRIQSDHDLSTKPFLVLNAPSRSRILVTESSPSVRKVCGLGLEVPLVIYSGGIHISRGMDLLVSSLEFMPDVHLAMTSNRESWYIEELKEKAARFNGAERLHFVPYVAPEEVVPYISTASVGISPLPADVVNYDLALPNKLFDYMQAKLPIVSSDCFEVSELLSRYPLGEVFDWRDPKALTAAVKSAIETKSEISQVYESLATEIEKFTWEYQEVELEKAYAAAQIPTVNQ
jgi:glycosyltransferase involved in cell wall biosynthesis